MNDFIAAVLKLSKKITYDMYISTTNCDQCLIYDVIDVI